MPDLKDELIKKVKPTGPHPNDSGGTPTTPPPPPTPPEADDPPK